MKLVLLLLILITNISALLIRSNTKVYDTKTKKPFCILFDSTVVYVDYDNKSDSLLIDLDCFVKKSINMKNDTLHLFNSYAKNDTIGFLLSEINLVKQDFFSNKNNETLQMISIYGLIDSSNIYSFEPWNDILKKTGKHIINMNFYEINNKIKKTGHYLTPLNDNKRLQYSHTYDEQRPTPNIAVFYVFLEAKLKGIWTKTDLDINNKIKINKNYLYYSDEIKNDLEKVKEDIKFWLNYRP